MFLHEGKKIYKTIYTRILNSIFIKMYIFIIVVYIHI